MSRVRIQRTQHRVGAGDEKKPHPADLTPDIIDEILRPNHLKTTQRKHKPVLDLFSHHALGVQKFDMLSACNPNVKHVYVGHDLDPNFRLTGEKTGAYHGMDWNPDEK